MAAPMSSEVRKAREDAAKPLVLHEPAFDSKFQKCTPIYLILITVLTPNGSCDKVIAADNTEEGARAWIHANQGHKLGYNTVASIKTVDLNPAIQANLHIF